MNPVTINWSTQKMHGNRFIYRGQYQNRKYLLTTIPSPPPHDDNKNQLRSINVKLFLFYVCNKYCCNYLGQHRDKVKSQHIGKLTSRRILSFDDVSKSLARSMRSMNLSQFCADVDI